MTSARVLRLLVFIVSVYLVPFALFAQSNACPPGQREPEDDQTPTGLKVVIDQVEFVGDNLLPQAEQAEAAKRIKENHEVFVSSETHHNWAEEAAEVVVRDAFQNRGYFRVLVHYTLFLIRATANELHYALQFQVESGPQYRLGMVRFESTNTSPLAFTDATLRQQLDLQTGAISSQYQR